MAVIQDLPPELLSRILELAVELNEGVPSSEWTPEWKRGLSLVSRDWVEPGQQALVSHVDLYEKNWKFFECASRRQKRTATPLMIGRLQRAGSGILWALKSLGQIQVYRIDLGRVCSL